MADKPERLTKGQGLLFERKKGTQRVRVLSQI